MRLTAAIRSAFALLTGLPVGLGRETPRTARLRVNDDAAPSAHATPVGSVPAGDVAGFFPLVGVVLGALPAGLVWIVMILSERFSDGLTVQRGAWPLAVIVVVWFAYSTRMLHLDGLADVWDAMWATDATRRLEIMADSAIGAFGATALALALIAEVSAIATMLESDPKLAMVALVVIPAHGRVSATASCWLGRNARPDGLGASALGHPGPLGVGAVVITLVGLAATVWSIAGLTGGAALLAGALVALTVPHLTSTRFGGVTGDVMGAGIVMTEVTLMGVAAFAMVW